MIECVGEVAYKLLLPASMSCIHPVSHVMLLQKYKDGERRASSPPAVLPDDEEDCEIQQALAGKVMWQEASASARVLCVMEGHGACTQWMAF